MKERTYKIEEFEQIILSEIESSFYFYPEKKAHHASVSQSKRNLDKSSMRKNPVKKPTFENSNLGSFKKLEKEAKRGFFDKSSDLSKYRALERALEEPASQTPIKKSHRSSIMSKTPQNKPHPRTPVNKKGCPSSQYTSSIKEEDKENMNNRNFICEQEEVVKVVPKKKPLKEFKESNKQLQSKIHQEESYNFTPKLSKASLAIASNLGNPLERLLSTKKTNKKSKTPSKTDLTFTPKINSKSKLLDHSRRDRSSNRFQELHDQARTMNQKKEFKRIQKERETKIREREECAFQPQRVSTYVPDHLNEMKFLERSYIWKKRVEQKLEGKRKDKEEAEEEDLAGCCPSHSQSQFLNPSHTSSRASHITSMQGLPEAFPPAPQAQPHPKSKSSIEEKLNDIFGISGEASDELQQRKLNLKYLHN